MFAEIWSETQQEMFASKKSEADFGFRFQETGGRSREGLILNGSNGETHKSG